MGSEARTHKQPPRFTAHGNDGKFFIDNHFYDDNDPRLDLFGSKQKRAQWRAKNRGPAYHKFGRAVKYHGSDLNEYIESCTVETKQDL